MNGWTENLDLYTFRAFVDFRLFSRIRKMVLEFSERNLNLHETRMKVCCYMVSISLICSCSLFCSEFCNNQFEKFFLVLRYNFGRIMHNNTNCLIQLIFSYMECAHFKCVFSHSIFLSFVFYLPKFCIIFTLFLKL